MRRMTVAQTLKAATMAAVLAAVSLTNGVGEAFAGVPTTAAIAPAMTASARTSPAQPVAGMADGMAAMAGIAATAGVAAGVPVTPGVARWSMADVALARDALGAAARVGLLTGSDSLRPKEDAPPAGAFSLFELRERGGRQIRRSRGIAHFRVILAREALREFKARPRKRHACILRE